MKTVRVGLVQMCSTADVAENLEAASGYVSAAAKDGAQWVALPENFAYMRREGLPVEVAQSLDGEIAESLRDWARRHQCWILGGTFAESIPDSEKVYNTSLLLSPEGEIVGPLPKDPPVRCGPWSLGWRELSGVVPVSGGRDSGGRRDPIRTGGQCRCVTTSGFQNSTEAMRMRALAFSASPVAFAPATGKDHWEVLPACTSD